MIRYDCLMRFMVFNTRAETCCPDFGSKARTRSPFLMDFMGFWLPSAMLTGVSLPKHAGGGGTIVGTAIPLQGTVTGTGLQFPAQS